MSRKEAFSRLLRGWWPEKPGKTIVPKSLGGKKAAGLLAVGLAVTSLVMLNTWNPFTGPGSQTTLIGAVAVFDPGVPPFQAIFVIRAPGYSFREAGWYRDVYAWRREILEDSRPWPLNDGGAGSFWVWDGERRGVYNAYENYFDLTTINASRPGFCPPSRWLQVNGAMRAPSKGIPPWEQTSVPLESYFEEWCEVLPEEQVAGRPARHLYCEEGYAEYWLDAETGLILKNVEGGWLEVEVVSIEYNPVFPPGIFKFVPPLGARELEELREDPYYYVEDLAPGEVAPTWILPLLNGSSLNIKDTRGRPTLVLIWSDNCIDSSGEWIDPSTTLHQFQRAFEEWADRVEFISIVNPNPQRAEKIMEEGGYTFPVVLRIGDAWGVRHGGCGWIWVLLDADGRVVDVRMGSQTLAQLDELLLTATSVESPPSAKETPVDLTDEVPREGVTGELPEEATTTGMDSMLITIAVIVGTAVVAVPVFATKRTRRQEA